MNAARLRWGLGALVLVLLAPSVASANWTASGTFRYQDREWDATGFTGVVTERPIRLADVDVVDPNKTGAKAIIGKGKTDANGAFSIAVTDSQTRTVYVRVLTQTTRTSGLFVKVVSSVSGSVYAVSSASVANHSPNVNVNFGVMVAAVGGGGEAFNVFDHGILGADYIKYLTGSWPNSKKLVTFKWASNGGIGASSTSGNTVTLRDTAGYDDTVILHEWGHYAMYNYSKSSNPGGTHMLADCGQDIRLAFDEGRASFFGCAVRRHNSLVNSNLYLRTSGGSGPGHMENYYDLEDNLPFPCLGATSEVTVSRTLWDIGDGPNTTDGTPGDEGHDRITLVDTEPWQVFTGPIKNATNVTHESFWDGWFDPTVANGFFPDMRDIFDFFSVQYFPDAFEPNNTAGQAGTIVSNASPLALTLFYDPDGDHKGQGDTDVFALDATSGVTYTIETLNLLSDANTYLEVVDTNGSTVLASNDNRASGDDSSLITWTAPRTDRFYVRVIHSADWGIYGSYNLRVTNP
jgi:hypothetical protein